MAPARAAWLVGGGIAGALAGAICLLLLTVPAWMLLFALLWCLQRLIGRLDGAAQITWNLLVIMSMAGLLASGAILGIVAGWGVGVRVASGASVSSSLAASRVCGAIARCVPWRTRRANVA